MRTSRLIGTAYLIFCGLLFVSVAMGWLATSAPIALFPAPTPAPGDTVRIQIAYSSEKERWLKQALAAWQATNPQVDGSPIQVELVPAGSQDMVARIEDGSLKPAAVLPASSLQVAQLNASMGAIVADSQALVYTPLVVVAWNDPAAPAGRLASSDGALWQTIHDSVLKGDRTFLFGQTLPDTSNSGLQTLLLMAYAFHNQRSGLAPTDITNSEFQEWLRAYVQKVERFSTSTGSLMDDMIRFGPSRYSAVTVYEVSALERMNNARNSWGELHIVYPPANLWSDHPFAVVNADWTTPDQRTAATQFRSFLLAQEQQQQAVQFGFRPTNPDVALDGAESPFTRYAANGVQLDPGPIVEPPSAETIDALLDFWAELKPLARR